MAQVVIENPVLNSPFREPARHFDFGQDGITDRIVETRRPSSYFVPIPAAKKKGKQLQFETEWTKDRIEEMRLVNQVRERVSRWRTGGYVDVTPVTRRLLDYWTNPDRDKPLFFCQRRRLREYGVRWHGPGRDRVVGKK